MVDGTVAETVKDGGALFRSVDDGMSVSKMVAPLVILTMMPLLVTTRKVGTLLMVEFLINCPGVNHTADHMLGVWSVKCAMSSSEEICQ